MSDDDVAKRLARLESLIEEQQATIEKQQATIDQQQESIERLSAQSGDVSERDGSLRDAPVVVTDGGDAPVVVTDGGDVKVIGEISADDATGVLGKATGSGQSYGVRGEASSSNGYGLSTPDDARIGGTTELSALAGSITGETPVTSITGDGLTLDGGALALGPTSIRTDTASTFNESDVTVNYTRTDRRDGDLGLAERSVARGQDDTTFSTSNKMGIEIEPQVDLLGVTATISSNTSGESTVYLTESDGTQLASEPSPGAGNSVALSAPLSSGTKYYVVADAGGNSYTAGSDQFPGFPYRGSLIDITSGVFDGNTASEAYTILAVSGAVKSGTATVEFSRPSSVRRWESVSFDTRKDGETAEVFVETSSDDGSTWQDWQSEPIGPGTDLSAIPPGDYVRFRAELSRTDTATDPRLTLLSRQYACFEF